MSAFIDIMCLCLILISNNQISCPSAGAWCHFPLFDGTLYPARKGHGAFCDGVRLQVSKEKGLLVFMF